MNASAPAAVTRITLPRSAALAPVLLAIAAYIVLFGGPLRGLASDWWNDPEAGHGLLLAPLAVWLIWRTGIRNDIVRPQPVLGASMLAAAVALRYVGGLASEVFTMRAAALGAVLGLIIWIWGVRQVLVWWLPLILLTLSIPLPSLITTALAFPLQLRASAMGAALLEMRNVPVQVSGNIIQLPGQSLFVTEACSGLRSLTALISLGVLIGGLWLRQPWSRILLVLLAIPVAILINAVRVFLTGFLVFFVSQKMGEGFMHVTEGWLMFLVAFGMLGLIAFGLDAVEKRLSPPAVSHA
jgi:exosortase